MVYIQNITQFEGALRYYIKEGDYSHPFVVSGWSGIGKTAIADKVQIDNPTLDIVDFDLKPDDKKTQRQIIDAWNTPSYLPTVVCITNGIDISAVRKLALKGCKVHYFEPDARLFRHAHREVIDIYNSQLAMIDEMIQSIVSYQGNSYAELRELLVGLSQKQHMLYFFHGKVYAQWIQVLDAWTGMIPRFYSDEVISLGKLIRQICKAISTDYL